MLAPFGVFLPIFEPGTAAMFAETPCTLQPAGGLVEFRNVVLLGVPIYPPPTISFQRDFTPWLFSEKLRPDNLGQVNQTAMLRTFNSSIQMSCRMLQSIAQMLPYNYLGNSAFNPDNQKRDVFQLYMSATVSRLVPDHTSRVPSAGRVGRAGYVSPDDHLHRTAQHSTTLFLLEKSIAQRTVLAQKMHTLAASASGWVLKCV